MFLPIFRSFHPMGRCWGSHNRDYQFGDVTSTGDHGIFTCLDSLPEEISAFEEEANYDKHKYLVIWCCAWRGNCQCASGTLGEPSRLTFLSLLTPCNHWGKDHHYLLPAEVFPGCMDLAPKAYGYLENFRAAVNGPENACDQSGRLASGRFPGS